MNFLDEEADILTELSELHATKSGKLLLNGENVVKLVKAELINNKNPYIQCTFTRKPANVYGLIGKVSFAPHLEFFFNYERLAELCKAFGHELGSKPPEMMFKDYYSHVVRRLNTFTGRELKVVTAAYKERRKDGYGDEVSRNKYYDELEEVWDWRVKVLSFHALEENVKIDWNLIYNTCTGGNL